MSHSRVGQSSLEEKEKQAAPMPQATMREPEPKQETAISEVVYPVVSVRKLVEHMKLLQELKGKLLTQEDWILINNKPFIKRSGWRKYALAFGISDEIVKAEKEDLGDGDYVWRIWVRAIESNGRSVIGVGSCSTKEREFVHEEHDLYAIAHTRAKNRAISDLIGSGELSAEELVPSQVDSEKVRETRK